MVPISMIRDELCLQLLSFPRSGSRAHGQTVRQRCSTNVAALRYAAAAGEAALFVTVLTPPFGDPRLL